MTLSILIGNNDCFLKKFVEALSLPSTHHLADVLAKALRKPRFLELANKIGVLDSTPILRGLLDDITLIGHTYCLSNILASQPYYI